MFVSQVRSLATTLLWTLLQPRAALVAACDAITIMKCSGPVDVFEEIDCENKRLRCVLRRSFIIREFSLECRSQEDEESSLTGDSSSEIEFVTDVSMSLRKLIELLETTRQREGDEEAIFKGAQRCCCLVGVDLTIAQILGNSAFGQLRVEYERKVRGVCSDLRFRPPCSGTSKRVDVRQEVMECSHRVLELICERNSECQRSVYKTCGEVLWGRLKGTVPRDDNAQHIRAFFAARDDNNELSPKPREKAAFQLLDNMKNWKNGVPPDPLAANTIASIIRGNRRVCMQLKRADIEIVVNLFACANKEISLSPPFRANEVVENASRNITESLLNLLHECVVINGVPMFWQQETVIEELLHAR